MTDPIPVRPSPYIAPGNGWTIQVQVPGFGRWSRNPQQVSLTYAVYNQNGRAFHITIDRAYIDDPSKPLNTHITSNAPVAGRVLHWPDPGTLSAAQQAWSDLYNPGNQFDDLIDAFETELQTRAANIQASRDYDRDLALYQQRRLAARQRQHSQAATFKGDLTDWVGDYEDDAYVTMFQDEGKTEWYVLDGDRGAVVRLDPKPRPLMDNDNVSTGFVNLCAEIVAKKPLDDAACGSLSAGLVLLRSPKGTRYAMLKSTFDACPLATGLLSLDHLVEQAAEEWAKDVASSPPYQKIASDNTRMNITGPDRQRYHVQLSNLVDMAELVVLGTGAARTKTDPLPLFADLPGVYATSSVSLLKAELPPVVRISGASQVKTYILQDRLAEGWSAELQKASSVDPTALANDLAARKASCQVFAENLLLDGEVDVIVYLLRPDETAYYVGSTDEIVPSVRVAKDKRVNLQDSAKQIKAYLGGGVSSATVAQNSDNAVVVCRGNEKPVTPVIFVDLSTLKELDLDGARKGVVIKEQERQAKEREKQKEAEAARKEVVDKCSKAWADIGPKLTKPGMAEIVPLEGSSDTIFLRYEKDQKVKTGWYRYLAIEYSESASEAWVLELKDYIRRSTPPTKFKGYVVTVKQL